jgi:hypothetical protein
MDSISHVIKRHQEQREIIELSQLNALSTQNLSYPFDKMTIVPKFWNMYKYISIEKYQKHFNNLFPEIGQTLASLNNSDIFVMGGACVKTLNNIIINKTSDIDFFIVGDYTEDDYFEIVFSLIDELKRQFHHIRCNEKVITGLIELSFVIPGNNPDIKIQIVLRHFPTIQDLLYNVDVPSSAIAYNGDNLLMSYMGAFSQLYYINIIYTPNYSANFSKRLLKYYTRGYGMCFPYLKKDIPDNFILDKMEFNIQYKNGSYIYAKNVKLVSDYNVENEKDYTDDNNYHIINKADMDFSIQQLTKAKGIKRWYYEKYHSIPSDFYQYPFDEIFEKQDLINTFQRLMLWNEQNLALSFKSLKDNYKFTEEDIIKYYSLMYNEKYEDATKILEVNFKKITNLYDEQPKKIDWIFHLVLPYKITKSDKEFYGDYYDLTVNITFQERFNALTTKTNKFLQEVDEKDDECSLCQNDINSNENYIKLMCGHKFHWKDVNDCRGLSEWIDEGHNTCPYCRRDIK